MKDFRETLEKIAFSKNLWLSLAVVAAAVLFWFALKKVLIKFLSGKKRTAKFMTHTKFIANIIKYFIIIFVVLFVLQINGINVSSVLTGLGVAGVVVGFALQDLLKDIIMGTNILIDDFFSVGDIVSYKGIQAKVISFNLKATKLKDIDNENIITVSNRNISEITKISDFDSVTVPASYKVSAEKMSEICSKIVNEASKIEYVKKCTFEGTSELGENRANYVIFYYCKPEKKKPVKRQINRIVQNAFEAEKIEISHNSLYDKK